jgi:hypothetical protein
MQRGAVAILAVGALTLFGVACSDDGDGGDDATTTATTAATASATTEATTTATATEAATTTATATEEASDEINVVTVTATDYAFALDGEFVPGSNEIHLVNDGAEQHHLQLVHLLEGNTFDDLTAALSEPGPLPTFMEGQGGVGVIEPGQEGTPVFSDLPEGEYALLCFVETAEGVPHFAQGMALPVTIEGEANAAALPEADEQIVASDYAFEVPESVPAGEVTFELSNTGSEFHEATLFKLSEGVTVDQLGEILASTEPPPAGAAPPFAGISGINAVSPGVTQLGTFDLEAGNYAFLCFVPNGEGVPHFALGMIAPLTVE